MKRIRQFAALGSLCVLAAAGTGCPASGPRPLVVNSQYTVVMTNPVPAAPPVAEIDAHDPRIEAASRSIYEMLGHSITYEIDAALGAQFGSSLHHAFVAAVENVAAALANTRKYEPESYAYASKLLVEIAFQYTATGDAPAPALDEKTGILHIPVTPGEYKLLERSDIHQAFDKIWQAHSVQAYADRAPETVPPGERRAYFEFLQHHYLRGNTPQERTDAFELDRVGKLLKLYQLNQDDSLRRDLREWLLGRADDLNRVNNRAESGPLAASLRTVVAGYNAWLNTELDGLNESERRNIAEVMLSRRYGAHPSFRQGLDILRLATPVADAWIKANRSAPTTKERDASPLETVVVCPVRRDWSGMLDSNSYCRGAMYAAVVAEPNGPRRLVDWMVQGQRDALVESATLSVTEVKGTETILAFLEALEPKEAWFLVSLRALADYSGWRHPPLERDDTRPEPAPMIPRIARWWSAYPSRRGPLLYLLAQLSRETEGLVVWTKIPQLLGAPIGPSEFAAFLDQSARAMDSVEMVSRGLGPGWSRAAAVLPRFERWLNFQAEKSRGGPEPYYLTEHLVDSFCESGSLDDIGQLRAFLRARLERYPSEKGNLGSFLEGKPERLCAAESPARRARKGNQGAPEQRPALFGD